MCAAFFKRSTVVLTGFYSRQDFHTSLRRIKFKNPQTGKRLVFLTTGCSATITELYRRRSQVELLFKWIADPEPDHVRARPTGLATYRYRHRLHPGQSRLIN